MTTRINKHFNIPEYHNRPRPISASRTQHTELNQKNSFIKYHHNSAKNSSERTAIGGKVNSSLQNASTKENPLKVIKAQGQMQPQEGGRPKNQFNPLLPFGQKSRNGIQKKGLMAGTHCTSSFKSKGQLGNMNTTQLHLIKNNSLSPNSNVSTKANVNVNVVTPSQNVRKGNNTPANFSKIIMKNKKAKKPIGAYSIKVSTSQANRSITPILKPKLSTSYMRTKSTQSRTKTPIGFGNYSPFKTTLKGFTGFKANGLSHCHNGSHKNLQIISDKDMIHTGGKVNSVKAKNSFSYPNAKATVITTSMSSLMKSGKMQNEADISNTSALSTFSPNNQGNTTHKELEKERQSQGQGQCIKTEVPTIFNVNQSTKIQEPKVIMKGIKRMHEFSKTGYAGEDEKKVNQDNYFVFRNFVNSSKNMFMAVCDGHGAVGQEISGFIKENLPNDLNRIIQSSKLNIITDSINDLITQTFIQTNDKLTKNEMINSMLSGSTCVSLIYTPQKLITANVGDSRAILGKCINKANNEWKSFDLTRDHKPGDKDELKRIKAKGGRVEPMRDEDDGSFIGPLRVWVQEDEYPGLAMSRSFGDKVAHSLGVIPDPEIKEYKFEAEDRFFIVASDGLFEFISSQEIVDIVKEYYERDDIVGCCEYLHIVSSEKWMKEEEVVDDITMIIVFLKDE